MALINCPECKKEISDKTKSCPYCGYPINDDGKLKNFFKEYCVAKKKTISITLIILVVLLFSSLLLDSGLLRKKCAFNACDNKVIDGGEYCVLHTCIESGCVNFAKGSYCAEHKSNDISSKTVHYISGSNSSTRRTNQNNQMSENALDALEISNIYVKTKTSYTVCTGTVTNSGKKTYKFIKVKGAFKDWSGSVIDTDWTYAVGAEGLAPGESSRFEMSVKANSSINDCDVIIFDYD